MKHLLLMLSQIVIASFLFSQESDFCNFYIRSGFDSECIITNYKPDESPQALYDEHQCLVACRGSHVTYSIVGLPNGATYQWTVSGANSYTTNTNYNNITIYWSESVGNGNITLSVYGPNDEFCEKQLCVDLIEKPVAGIVSNPTEAGRTPSGIQYIDVCDGQEIQFYDNSTSSSDSPIVGYYWSVGNETASTQNFTFTADYIHYGTTVYIKHRVVNECGCEDETVYIVNISNYPKLKVDCFGTACENTSATYHATDPCPDYIWYVEGGHIQDGQGTSSLTVMWDDIDNGYGYIALNGVSCGQTCPSLTYLPIPVISDNAEIQGPDVVCVDDIVYYELPQWASTEYTWGVYPIGYTTYSSGHPHKLLVKFRAPGTYTINCNYNCTFLECGGIAQTKTVIVTKPFAIVAKREACVGEPVTFSTDYPTDVFDWTIYHNGTAIYTQTGANITYAFNAAGGYTIEASSPNFCNTAYFSININELPPTPNPYPDVLSWTNRVCLNTGYEYNATTSPEYYLHWRTTCGQPSEFDGNQYNVVIGNSLGTIELYNVNRNTGCMSLYPFQYQLTQFVPQTINWPTYNVCANEEFTMRVPPEDGVLLEWDMVSTTLASIVSDRFVSTVTIQTNNVSGTFYMVLKRTFCDEHISDTIPVVIKPYLIPNINMPSTICQYGTATISANNTEQIQGIWTLNVEGSSLSYTGTASGAVWQHTFNTAGTTPVSLSFSANGCSQTYETVEQINVVAVPQFSLSYIETTPDFFLINASIMDNNTSNYSYQWNPSGSGQTVQHNGPFHYTCTVTNNITGCSSSKDISYDYGPACRIKEDTILITSRNCNSFTFYRPNTLGNNITWTIDRNYSNATFTTYGTNNNYCQVTFPSSGYYRITAKRVIDTCSFFSELQICVPLMPRINVGYLCCPTQSGGCYYLVLNDISDFMNGTIINYTNWYVDGILVANPASHHVYNGTHTVQLIVNYTYNGITETCSSYETINYNAGTTSFSVSNSPYCSKTGIQFTDNSTNAVSWDWNFSNGNSTGHNQSQNPEQSFINNLSSQMYVLTTLTTQDNLGCISQASIVLPINPNTLQGSIAADPTAICYGNPWTIEYNYLSELPPSTNPVYLWHETNQTTSIPENNFYETGSYYVRVTDNNGCATQSDWANICFKPIPVAEITGDSEYCPDGTIKLFGNSGDNTYLWTGLGPYPHNAPNISVDASGLNSGNYTVTLTVTKNGCSSTDTKAITIHSAPATPLIGFGANSCLHIPPVDLISTASQNLNWSTGDYGTYTDTYNAGIHTAYYTDPTTGCRSANAEIDVPKPPDFNELMTGCFEFCKEDLPRNVLGPWGDFDSWKWHLFNTAIQYGSGWITNPLPVQTFGTYFLYVLYGGGCQTTSDNLVVSQKEICDTCNIDISFEDGIWCVIKDCQLRVQFYLRIYNQSSGTATLYGINSPSIGNLYTPYLPTAIAPGTYSNILFEMDLSELNPLVYMEFLFHDGTGRECISHYSLDISSAIESCITNDCGVKVEEIIYNPSISLAGMSYYQYLFYTQFGLTNVRLYSDDVTIVDVNYNPSSGAVSGLFSITPLELQQLIDSSENICFTLYACKNDDICKTTFCIPASMLSILGSKSVSTQNDSEDEKGEVPNIGGPFATDFCLYPNPATSTVNISGDNFSRATVIDTGGRVVMEVYDTSFDIGMLHNGEYIVKVVSFDGAIQYLKLVKR